MCLNWKHTVCKACVVLKTSDARCLHFVYMTVENGGKRLILLHGYNLGIDEMDIIASPNIKHPLNGPKYVIS